MDLSPRQQNTASYMVGLMFTLTWPAVTYAEWTEWLTDAEFAYQFQDNINRSFFRSGELAEHQWQAFLSTGRVYQLDTHTRLFADVRLDGTLHQNYDDLNQLSSGVSLAARHKFGVGPYQPWVSVSASSAYIFSRSRLREGYRVNAGVIWGKALHQRLDVRLSYDYDFRDSRNPTAVSNKRLNSASLETNTSNKVFDTQGHSFGIRLQGLLTTQWMLILGYQFRTGDIVSINDPGLLPGISRIVDAVAVDDALPGWAYRVDGETHRYSADVNYAFMQGHAAFNIGYEFIDSHADDFRYRNNLLRVNLTYSF